MKLHVTYHAIVETQAAMGDETSVRQTLARLIGEGVDRREGVHAVGSTLAWRVTKIVRGRASGAGPSAPYFAALEKLTIKSWRRDFG